MKVTIEAMRVNRHLSGPEASAKLGVKRQTLRNWEKGLTTPSTAKLVLLMNVYDCTPDDIILPKKLTES